ncbi:MAG: translation elongation factor Ts [Omnitrophica bacterium RIFCSPLOWO2_01_FULL_45_10b]|nr:MAG: translation elongation factor Ts [Omnitrophica bacterium RIFCSPLOWO2_01_FULL_45_10b]
MVKDNSADQVRELRNATGAGIMDCKRALMEAKGDFQAAQQLLRKRGFEIAQKKSGRTTKEGQIFSYVHLGGKIGVLVEIDCETDFVARNSEFQQFGRDVAMQIAAAHPLFVSREEIDPDWLEQEKEVFQAQVKDKPAKIQDQIIQGKLDKRFEEVCLLNQRFIKNEDTTIQDLLTGLISKLGEHVVIKRFRRFEIGSE